MWGKAAMSLDRLSLKSRQQLSTYKVSNKQWGWRSEAVRAAAESLRLIHFQGKVESFKIVLNPTQLKAVTNTVVLFGFHFFDLPVRHQKDI